MTWWRRDQFSAALTSGLRVALRLSGVDHRRCNVGLILQKFLVPVREKDENFIGFNL